MGTKLNDKTEILGLLRAGKFDEALEQSAGMELEFHAVHSATGSMVVDRRNSILYEEENVEDAYEAEILALWHSLDSKATFTDIVIDGMGKHYINGVRVDINAAPVKED